jgi:hypothetical protein
VKRGSPLRRAVRGVRATARPPAPIGELDFTDPNHSGLAAAL